ncbi:GAF sensor-containing diguanylate cyclase [Nitzschia inconspicua]|uniref:GAF sensor-containing diguanylate cyclase n=1 Tax=Nitzschia inconspicua TaxID=303405 RepID=A0A9K3PL87_9STRA|nr:GAF sensor-containing diguanylate cyclase [Nitzschia inconspicua]
MFPQISARIGATTDTLVPLSRNTANRLLSSDASLLGSQSFGKVPTTSTYRIQWTSRAITRGARNHRMYSQTTRMKCSTISNHSLLRSRYPGLRIRTQHRLSQSSRQAKRPTSSNAKPSSSTSTTTVPEPPFKTLKLVAFTTSIPFVGFGFMDNAILVLAGDAIDTTLGVMLGMSTLCAAAIGNIISDLCGIGLGTLIEDFCANTLKLPVPQLTTAQRQLRSVRYASQFGTAVGMTIGCILGMFPLLFIDTNKADKLRKKAQLENLFQDVLLEGKSLVSAETTTLYLRVNKDENTQADQNHDKSRKDGGFFSWIPWPFVSSKSSGGLNVLPFKPSPTGEYLYAMYYLVPSITPPEHVTTPVRHRDSIRNKISKDGHHASMASLQHRIQERLIPLGRGIVSRAVLTCDTWNIADVTDEPDFFPYSSANTTIPNNGSATAKTSSDASTKQSRNGFRTLVVVPILDGRGRAIGVLEALNKISDETHADEGDDSFTDQDVEILKSLASHISVSLQVFYQDNEDGESRLRDTIRIFKEMGIQGITDSIGTGMEAGGDGTSGDGRIPTLFPSSSNPPVSRIPRSKSSKLFPAD